MSTNLLCISIYFTYALLFLYLWSCFTFYFERGHFLLMTSLYSQPPVIRWLIALLLSTSLVAVVKCLGFRSQGLSPVHSDTSTGAVLVQVLFRQSWCWEVTWEVSDIPRRHRFIANYLNLSGLYNVHSLLQYSLSLKWGNFM